MPALPCVLRRLAVAAALAWPVFAMPAPSHAQSAVSDADRAQIEQVITAQIDAFRAEDGQRAFTFASPHIQSMFHDAGNFMAMVAQGYPPVHHPSSVEFTELATEDGQLIQHVELVGPNGVAALALYSMEREPDGSWRIDGCQLTQTAKVAT